MTTNFNASETYFGIEIEGHLSIETVQRERMTIGNYHHGIQVPFLPTGWSAERDGSIRTPNGRVACEIVSPKLKGAEGIAEVIRVLGILNEKGMKVNTSCGLHCSVYWDRNNSSELLSKLISITSYLESGLFAITGTKSRERGTYCNGIKKWGNAKNAKKYMDPYRYTTLNITNLYRGCDRVEFRVFSGSTSATKIVGWIQVCIGIVERALTTRRLPAWNPKPTVGGWKKTGPGASECERLMGYLAWSDGCRRLHNGKQFGWISDEISQDEIKKEFRRLAKQYDAEP